MYLTEKSGHTGGIQHGLSQELEDLFASATGTLFGLSFAEKAAEYLKQLQTLR